MIKKFEKFEYEVADEHKLLKEEMELDDEDDLEDEDDLDDDEDEFEDEDDLEDEDDDDFDDYEDGGARDILSIRAQKLFEEYNMNEKTIRYLLNKCKEFPCIQDTDLGYLHLDNKRGSCYGRGWYIAWGDKSKKIKFNERYIPVVMLELRINVSLGGKTMDLVDYDMIIWTEDDNYISYIRPIRCDDDDRLGRPIALGVCKTHREPQYPTKVTMEDFFKMLQAGPFVKK